MKKRQVQEETNAETWTQSKKRPKMNAWQEYISHKIDVSMELAADFNFLKIHLMPHWVAHVCRYGALQQYTAERHEQAHQLNRKDGWNASNHNLNYLPQVITFLRRILCVKIGEVNIQALTQRRESSAAACNVLPSGADVAAPQSPHSYAKPKFMWPQICRDRKHPDAMIQDFRASLHNT